MDLITRLNGEALFDKDFSLHFTETHSLNAKLSEKPSEEGFTIADNVNLQPSDFEIDMIITKDVKDAWNKLKSVMSAEKYEDRFLNVYTKLEDFEKVLIKSANVTLNDKKNNVLIVKINFVQPKITKLEEVENKKFQTKKKRGVKTGNDLSNPKTEKDKNKKSFLSDLIGVGK